MKPQGELRDLEGCREQRRQSERAILSGLLHGGTFVVLGLVPLFIALGFPFLHSGEG
jgi:hypothetical protein